jgi:hypothetical protein
MRSHCARFYLRLGRADLPVRLSQAPIRMNRATADRQVRPTKLPQRGAPPLM